MAGPVRRDRRRVHHPEGRPALSGQAPRSRGANILLICDDRRGHANTVLDHIAAFKLSRHRVRTFNPKAMRRSFALDLNEFDAVVLHYSIVASNELFIAPDLREKLRRFRGLKIQFLQDDYRWPDRATAFSRDVGIDVLFTVAPEPAASLLYDERLPGVRRVHTLTGYVPDNLRGLEIAPLDTRPLDVGYRARDLPFWLGRLSREKMWIGERFLEAVRPYGLRCDIAWTESQRIYGRRWVDFVSSCRTMLGTESGASIADFDGSVERGVRAYLRRHPAADFEEVHAAVLAPYEGNVVVNVVSPRVFEAAALGTAMVMFPGEYSGVVKADVHYIPLEKDFSNIAEVVAKIRDDGVVSAIVARARADVIDSGRYGYQAFIDEFDRVVDEELRTVRGTTFAPRYALARAERALKVPGIRVRVIRGAVTTARRVTGRKEMEFAVEYDSQVEKGVLALAVAMRDRDLRPLLTQGRRRGFQLDRLLREILELWLLRKAAAGDFATQHGFTVAPEFDVRRQALCAVSTPAGVPAESETFDREAALAALRNGELRTIEWDHRAAGGTVELDRPRMDVGIGYQGLETFNMLAELGRSAPGLVERALAPLLGAPGALAHAGMTRERGRPPVEAAGRNR